jgi:SAM-dependent methyltransferase
MTRDAIEVFMSKRDSIGHKAEAFFDDLWGKGDPWELETSAYESARYARLLGAIDQRRYPNVLEIGCGAGSFTKRLAPLAQRLLAVDVSQEAIRKAQVAFGPTSQVEFRVANIMDYDPQAEGPWDLIVMSEMIYFLGWLYSFFEVSWFASRLFDATRSGGRLLLANSQGDAKDPLLLPWIIRTYRDLFVNVGYTVEKEEIFQAQKSGVEFEVLISLFTKANPEPIGSGGA